MSWSADSRLLCSGSADSTLKVWDVAAKKLLYDLPGHADEVRGYNVTIYLFIGKTYRKITVLPCNYSIKLIT